MKWIGLTGRAGAGKDHTFEQLQKLLPELDRVSFADGLRHDIEEAMQQEYMPVLWDKPLPDSVRRLLQWWGTEYRRAEDENYWVSRAWDVAQRVVKAGKTPVFTDVRFANEAKMIKDNGGILVRVSAPLLTRERRLGTLPPEHASEVEQDSIVADLSLLSVPDKHYVRNLNNILVEARIDDLMEGIIESFNT